MLAKAHAEALEIPEVLNLDSAKSHLSSIIGSFTRQLRGTRIFAVISS